MSEDEDEDDTKKALKPDDPTPDPESPIDALSGTIRPSGRGTTFVDVAEAAKTAAIGTSDGAGKVLGEVGSGGHTPLSHHAIREARKLLVPIVTAVIAALSAGGFAEWRAGTAKDKAVEEARKQIDASELRSLEIEKIRTEIRKELLKDASWDNVGKTLKLDKASATAMAVAAYKVAMSSGHTELESVDLKRLEELVHNEAAQIQLKVPPRPDSDVATQPR